MSLTLSPEQTNIVKQYRDEYVKNEAEIEALKLNQTEAFEALFDKLKLDKKVDKEKISSLKMGFKLYYKQNALETQKLTDDAVVVAEL